MEAVIRRLYSRRSLPMSHQPIRTFLLVVCLLTAAQSVAKLRLVPISDAVVITAQSSNPASLQRVGNQVFFSANDGTHGVELWRSDGTTNGTAMVVDLLPGVQSSQPQIVGTLGNAVLFTAYDAVQRALWRSDGTE